MIGSNRKLSIKEYDSITFPPKKEREDLNKLIKQEGLWADFSEIDPFKLKNAITKNKLPSETQKKLEKFITHVKSFRINLTKK